MIKFLQFLPLVCLAAPLPTAEAVYDAIRRDDQVVVKAWIASGWDANSPDARGSTPLLHAAGAGNAAMVRTLLAAGANPKIANGLGVTPLLLGAADAVKAKLLIEAGADVNAAAGTGRTPLIVAAAVHGNSATVKLLLERGADPKAADKFRTTALLAAASANDLASVRALAEKGAEPGPMALHAAASNRNVEMAKFLLARGAKVNEPADFGNQVKHGRVALGRITPLMLTAPYGPPELVRALLAAGADVNAADERGMTPLIWAVSSEVQDPVVVKMLLAKGARREDRSAAGETALDWARKFNRAPVLALLGGAAIAPAAVSNAGESVSVKEAVVRGVELLERSQTEFFKQGGCVACHHSISGAMASHAAQRPAAEGFRRSLTGQTQAFAPVLVQLVDPPGGLDTAVYVLLGFESAGAEPSAVSDAMAIYTLRQVRAGGMWSSFGISRSPISEGTLHRTALAVRGLNRYLPPSFRAEYSALLKGTLTSVRREAVRTTDDAAMKILALRALAAPDTEVRAAGKALESRQRADGGWSGNPALASDAYATGLSLFALAEGGARDGAGYRRGAEFLTRTQQPDGSWHVRSRSPKFQPYFESGFPYGGDQWISNAATSWAVAGLAASPR